MRGLGGVPHASDVVDGDPSPAITEADVTPVRIGITLDTASSLSVRMRFPTSIAAWADGTSAVTDGPKLQRYEQMYAERKRVADLIRAAMEPVLADANRVMETVRAIRAVADTSPASPVPGNPT